VRFLGYERTVSAVRRPAIVSPPWSAFAARIVHNLHLGWGQDCLHLRAQVRLFLLESRAYFLVERAEARPATREQLLEVLTSLVGELGVLLELFD
jgi:hypothetical protein